MLIFSREARVLIHTSGGAIPGVIGKKPIHLTRRRKGRQEKGGHKN